MDPLIAEHLDEIRRIAQRHGATRVRLVGSRARQDSRCDSDVDLLVSLEDGRNLLDIGGLIYDLETLLGKRVEVGEEEALRPGVRQRVLKDAVELC